MTIHVGDRVSWTRSYDNKRVYGGVTDVRPNRVMVLPDDGSFVFGKTADELVQHEGTKMRKLAAAITVVVATAAAVGALLSATVNAPVASAEGPVNCAQQYWLYGLRGTMRTICDGPVRPDGSWLRGRGFDAPAVYVPGYCSISQYSSYCHEGYWLPPVKVGPELYTVTPGTVLPDEPGHIDTGGAL